MTYVRRNSLFSDYTSLLLSATPNPISHSIPHSFPISAVRFGRMPKAEREKLVADKEELTNSCGTRIMELRTLSDTIRGSFTDCFATCKFIAQHLQSSQKLDHQSPVKVILYNC